MKHASQNYNSALVISRPNSQVAAPCSRFFSAIVVIQISCHRAVDWPENMPDAILRMELR